MSALVLIPLLLLVFLFALLEGFYSGAETGVYVLNRVRLRLRAEAGQPEATRLWTLLADLPSLITTTLVGTNLCVFASSAIVTRLLEPHTPNAEYLTMLILSPLLFVFAEVVPKNLFSRHADLLMYRAGRFLQLSALAFRPLVVVLRGVTAIGRLGGGEEGKPVDPLRSRQRLLSLLLAGAEEGVLSPYQHDLAENILRVASVPVKSAAVPLAQVVMIDEPVLPERVVEALRTAEHARYPLRSPDGEVRMLVEVTSYLLAARNGGPSGAGLRPLTRLPADTPVPRALELLQRATDPMGLVVDDAGSPLGIVTVKDLVEEIVGELGEW